MEIDFGGLNKMPLGALEGLLSAIKGRLESCYELYGPLTEADKAEWDAINNESHRLKSETEENEAKRQLFWCKINRQTGMYKRNLKIDGGILYVEKENHPSLSGLMLMGCEDQQRELGNSILDPEDSQE